MKVVNQYLDYKRKYNDYIVVIKSGNFYISFNDDATLLNYLLNYKIVNNKVGFPINSLAKVKECLKYNQINLLEVVDQNYYLYEKEKNTYKEKLEEAVANHLNADKLKILVNALEVKLRKNPANYSVLMEFIDEL